MAIYYWQAEIDVFRNYSASDNENRQIMRQGTVSAQTETYTVYPRFDDTETYTRTGYNFIGYGKTRDATVPTYQPHDSVPFTFTQSGIQYKQFYCLWQIQTYTITYNANGGTGAPSAQTKTYGQNLTLSATVPTRTNYTFQGWSTSSTGAVEYQPSDTFTTDANTTLYAIWEVAAGTLNSVTNPINIGASGTASWTKVNNSHTYKLVLSMSGATDVEVTASAGSTSCNYTIPNTWLNAIPNSTTSTATAVLYSYNGSTLVGSTSLTFTVNVAASVKPTISAFTATPHSANATVEGWNVAVQGYSYLTMSVTATAGTGASVSNILITGQGINQTSTATNGDTAILTDTGISTYTVTVTDTRGRASTSTVNVTVYEYASPTISSLDAVRCLSDGTQSDTEGNYLKAFPVFVFSSVNGNNNLSVKKIEYKKHTVSSWTVGVASVSSGAWSSVFGTADISKTYDVRCVITDALNNTYTLSVIVPPVVGFAIGLNNDRARFGGPVEKAGLQVDWDAEFKGVVDIIPRRCVATLSSSGWKRIMTITGRGSGSFSFTVDITIGRNSSNTNNETHFVKLVADKNSYEFMGELTKVNTIGVTKIRYTTDGDGNGYIDIYYSLSASNTVYVNFLVNCRPTHWSAFVAQSMTSVADAPTGETVETEYTFGTSTGAFFNALNAVTANIGTLNGISIDVSTIASGSSGTYSCPGGSKHLFLCIGASTNNRCFVLVNTTTTGAVTTTKTPTGSNITLTTATNSLTIASASYEVRVLHVQY